MKKNIKGTGRWIRGTAGVFVLGLGWTFQSWWGLLGLIPLGEALFSWCVIRHFCGSDDCGKSH